MPDPASDSPSKPPPQPRRWKNLAANLALLGFSLAVAAMIVEWGVRMLLPYYDPRNQLTLHRNEDGVAVGPLSVTTIQGTPKGDFRTTNAFNRHGFRDVKDFTRAQRGDVFVTGDSFSMGWGVEEFERYSNLLERETGTSFYNLAIPEDLLGYQRTLRYVEKHGTPVRHLVIGVCMENDLDNYELGYQERLAAFLKQSRRTFRHRAAYWMKCHSATWIFLSHTLQRSPFMRSLFEKMGISKNVDELTRKNNGTEATLRSSRNELLKIATNYHSVVLIIPSRGLWFGDNIAVEENVHAGLVGALREAGVDVVDVKPLLEQGGNPLAYYFRNDPHWNARGHAVAAGALLQFFREKDGWEFIRSASAPAGR